MACTWVKIQCARWLSHVLYPLFALLSLSGVFVWEHVGACEFMCDVKSSIVYHLSRSDKVQTKGNVHQRCKRRAGSPSRFLPNKKKNS